MPGRAHGRLYRRGPDWAIGRGFAHGRNRKAQSCLVTPGRGFYNPSNTALEAVVLISVLSALDRQAVRLLFPRAVAFVFTPLLGTPRSTE